MQPHPESALLPGSSLGAGGGSCAAGSGVCPVDVTAGRKTVACPHCVPATGLGQVTLSSPVSQCPLSAPFNSIPLAEGAAITVSE